MPLHELAEEIIRLSEWHHSTPVLVTPPYLSLRRPFFVELVSAIAERTQRPIRIDWHRRMPGEFSLGREFFAKRRVAACNRTLAKLGDDRGIRAKVQITVTIARPAPIEKELVVGLSNGELELPPWTTPIRLGGSPAGSIALQSSPIT